MASVFVLIVLLVSVQAAHKHHPKFPKISEDHDAPHLKKVTCSSDTERIRNDIIEKSKCGPPKEVFEYLEPQAAHQQISPGAVWVKRCVGLCDYGTYGSKCVPRKKQTRYIPVRIYDVKTDKETCATYAIEEHLSCGCCVGSADSCTPPRVYDPRKCACRCPNKAEKRNCRNQVCAGFLTMFSFGLEGRGLNHSATDALQAFKAEPDYEVESV